MTKKILVAALVAVALGIGSANAQVRQQKRIHEGVRSGEITRGERARIAKQKQDVRQEVREANADGVVTNAERREIRQEKRQVNRTINRTTNNEVKRK